MVQLVHMYKVPRAVAVLHMRNPRASKRNVRVVGGNVFAKFWTQIKQFGKPIVEKINDAVSRGMANLATVGVKGDREKQIMYNIAYDHSMDRLARWNRVGEKLGDAILGTEGGVERANNIQNLSDAKKFAQDGDVVDALKDLGQSFVDDFKYIGDPEAQKRTVAKYAAELDSKPKAKPKAIKGGSRKKAAPAPKASRPKGGTRKKAPKASTPKKKSIKDLVQTMGAYNTKPQSGSTIQPIDSI